MNTSKTGKTNKGPFTACIDIRTLEAGGRYRGYGYYINNIVKNIINIDKINNYSFLVYSEENPLYEVIKKRGFDVHIFSKPKIRPRFWWVVDQLFLPRLIKKIDPDIFVSLDSSLPLLSSRSISYKSVVVLHDLIPLVMKDEYKLPADRLLDYRLKLAAAKNANLIITISKHSKKDIESLLGIPSPRIKYSYEAVDESFSSVLTKSAVKDCKKKYAGKSDYLMTVGDYYGSDPRKNYLFLLDAFKNLIERNKTYSDMKILFVGRSGGTNTESSKIKNRAKKLGISSKVSFTGYVSNRELALLFGGAEAFVYPTKYEGFGLPILQAMSCGCPVIASNNTSIPEVAGEAAELFEKNDMESLVGGIEKVLLEKSKYKSMGYNNVKRFSWQKSAKEFVNYLEGLK